MTASQNVILHVDMDAFFAAVEQRDHPELKGKPVVVGAQPNQRGVVAAASYEARKYGIHSAMPSRDAGRLCPHAVFLPPNGARYEEVSGQVLQILERFTPWIEPVSIDEAFLDVTGARQLFGTGEEIAQKIRAAIRLETQLTASVGVACNKFLAKIASDMNKPDGLTVVPNRPAEIREFLAPMPVGRVWGVGKVTRQQLEKHGLRTIRDLQGCSLNQLAGVVGRSYAEHLLLLARGEDTRELATEWEEKSMSREHTFLEDCRSPDVLEQVLCDLVEDVGSRLRADGRYASLVHLKLRWQGFQTITRQRPLPRPVCDDFRLREAALALFRAQELAKPVRLVGFGVSSLARHPGLQMDLFAGETRHGDRQERLSQAVDAIRHRFGSKSILRASADPENEV